MGVQYIGPIYPISRPNYYSNHQFHHRLSLQLLLNLWFHRFHLALRTHCITPSPTRSTYVFVFHHAQSEGTPADSLFKSMVFQGSLGSAAWSSYCSSLQEWCFRLKPVNVVVHKVNVLKRNILTNFINLPAVTKNNFHCK